MREVLFFESMLTPKIITVVYWLMLLGVLVSGLGAMFTDYGGFWQGLGILIFGSIGVRIWCELLIVLFKIHENLKTLAERK
jgi:hypothetical protein